MDSFKTEIITKCKEYCTKNGKAPDQLRISTLRAMDLALMSSEHLSPDVLDLIILDGPVSYLEEWGFMGMKVVWLSDAVDKRIYVTYSDDSNDNKNQKTRNTNRRKTTTNDG